MPNQYRKGTVMVSLRLPSPLRERARGEAKRRKISVNRLIRDLLSQAMERDQGGFIQSDGGRTTDAYLKNIQRRAKKHNDLMAVRRSRALEMAPQIADLLRRRFGASHVALVGSMSKAGARIGPLSDIDMLVTGLRADECASATAAAGAVTDGEFMVDIIRTEDMTPEAMEQFFHVAIPI